MTIKNLGGGGVGAGGVAVSAAGSSANSGTVVFSNSNGITFGMNGSTITATVTPGAAAGIAAIQVSNTTWTTGTVILSNANGLTFGSSAGGGVTASYNSTQFAGTGTTFAGTNASGSITQNSLGLNLAVAAAVGTGTTFAGTNASASMTINTAGFNMALSAAAGGGGGAGISAGTQSVSTGTVVFSNSNGLTFGMSNSSIVTASYNSTQFAGTGTTFAGTNVSGSITQNSAGINLALSAPAAGGASTEAYYAVGNTTQSTSNPVPQSSVVFSGAGAISVGVSGSSVVISAPGTVALTQFSAGLTNSGNTAGNTGVVTGELFLIGSNNITVSGSTNAGSMTVSFLGAAAGGGPALSAGTQSVNTGTVVFSNSNGLTFGMSNSSIVTASYNSTQFAGTGTTFAGTNASASITLNSAGFNMALSAAAGGAGSGIISLSGGAGTSNSNVTGLTFANSNGITFGLSTGANVGTFTASYNSTQFAGTGTTFAGAGISGSMTDNSAGLNLSLSVPATSSLVGTNGIGVSTNGSTISVSETPISRSIWGMDPMSAISAPVNASISFRYINVLNPVSMSRVDAQVLWVAASAATTATMGIAISAYGCFYTYVASTLQSVLSGSTQTTYTYASNSAGNTQLITAAIRPISVPIAGILNAGEYLYGFNMITNSTSIGLSTTNLGQTLSMVGQPFGVTASNFVPDFNLVTGASLNQYRGQGVYSAASTGLSASYSVSGIVATGSSLSQANIALILRNN